MEKKAISKFWPVFMLPTLAAFTIGFVVPFGEGVWLSMCRFSRISNAKFVGLANFFDIASTDAQFFKSFAFTLKYAVVSIVLINFFAFAFALLLTRGMRGTNAFRTIFFMPNLIGGIVLGYIWRALINCVLSLAAKPLLDLNSQAGYWGLIILMCWQQAGYMMIIYIAGLQNVDGSLVEAAEIDGASPRQVLWHVKIPCVLPSFTICLFLTLTNSLKLYDQNLALTDGKPTDFTSMIAHHISKMFTTTNARVKGISQAEAMIFCIVVVCASLLQLRATKSREIQS